MARFGGILNFYLKRFPSSLANIFDQIETLKTEA
jgi:hypothetical protein